MTEWRLHDPATPPPFFGREWYQQRARAPHLEQNVHRERLHTAAALVAHAVREGAGSVVDLGCGDGGLLTLISGLGVNCWGYDLMPANVEAGRRERHVDVRYCDFVADPIFWADCAVATEVLEHLADPHGTLARIAANCRWLVASSPAGETDESHDEVHAWAWDRDGYRALVEQAGFVVVAHVVTETCPQFQLILGKVNP